MSASAVFDALVDAVGADQAAQALNAALDYARRHAGCTLPRGARIVDTGADLLIVFAHAPDCPALTEGEQP